MHVSNYRIISDDLQPICDELLNDSFIGVTSNEAYLSAFRRKFYKGDSTVKISLDNFYSVRQLERIFPYMVFWLLVFALRRIKVLKSNIK